MRVSYQACFANHFSLRILRRSGDYGVSLDEPWCAVEARHFVGVTAGLKVSVKLGVADGLYIASS